MGAASKRAKRVRVAAEFDVQRLAAELMAPSAPVGLYAWTLPDIFAARDEQMLGRFRLAARMAESMRTDDALYVAYTNRLAPQRCIKVALKPAGKGARAAAVSGEGEALFGQRGVGIYPDTLADIHGCLVNHGVAFAIAVAKPRIDGSRVDYFLKAWPIEFVRWDAYTKTFKTQVDSGPEETIVHGDGRWIIFAKNEIEPWKHGAILPSALVWARHAYGLRDWAKGSLAHGNAKIVGEMPEGVSLQEGPDGALSPQAASFLTLLRALASGEAPVGIRPAGSKTDFVANPSNAWQVFDQLVTGADKAAARIYLGTDGTMGSQGGAPGVDVEELFGVAATIVEGDLHCIERGLQSGLLEPWAAINFGSSDLAPQRLYTIPDADEIALGDSLAKRRTDFWADIASTKANGFEVTQEYVDALALAYNVSPPTLLPKPVAAAPAAPAAAPPLRAAS